MAAFALHRSSSEDNPNETRDTLFLLGGLSLIIFGAGLVVTNPAVKKMLGGVNATGWLHAVLPDVNRYFKLRSM